MQWESFATLAHESRGPKVLGANFHLVGAPSLFTINHATHQPIRRSCLDSLENETRERMQQRSILYHLFPARLPSLFVYSLVCCCCLVGRSGAARAAARLCRRWRLVRCGSRVLPRWHPLIHQIKTLKHIIISLWNWFNFSFCCVNERFD